MKPTITMDEVILRFERKVDENVKGLFSIPASEILREMRPTLYDTLLSNFVDSILTDFVIDDLE